MSLEIVDRYITGATLLGYAAQGLTLEQQRARPGPGAWSITELVVHLADTDLVFADRLKRVLAEENPTLVAFDEHAWLDRLGAQEMPMDDAVALFAANRLWMGKILARRPDSDFARAGRHTEQGRRTAAELLVYVTNHLDHHLKFLYAKRANMGVSLYPRYTTNPEG